MLERRQGLSVIIQVLKQKDSLAVLVLPAWDQAQIRSLSQRVGGDSQVFGGVANVKDSLLWDGN